MVDQHVGFFDVTCTQRIHCYNCAWNARKMYSTCPTFRYTAKLRIPNSSSIREDQHLHQRRYIQVCILWLYRATEVGRFPAMCIQIQIGYPMSNSFHQMHNYFIPHDWKYAYIAITDGKKQWNTWPLSIQKLFCILIFCIFNGVGYIRVQTSTYVFVLYPEAWSFKNSGLYHSNWEK